MKPVLLTGAAFLLAASSAAFAATTPSDTVAPAPAHHAATTANGTMDRTTTTTTDTRTSAVSDSAMFAEVPSGADMASKVIGLSVYNNANQDIGKIKDIALDPHGGVEAFIVAVGGFLGMGDHYVAVKPSAMKINYDSNAKKWHAAMNTNADQLKSAPEYKYSSND